MEGSRSPLVADVTAPTIRDDLVEPRSPEYEAGSQTDVTSSTKPLAPSLVEALPESREVSTDLGLIAVAYDIAKPKRIITRGKIYYEPQS